MFKLKDIIKRILTVLIVVLFFVVCVNTGNAQADEVTITNQNKDSKPPQPVVSNDKTKPNTGTSQFIPYAGLSDKNAKLFKASLEGNIQDIQIALAEGADVNIKDTDGNTALMLASANKNHANEIVKLLLDKGADINAKDNYGQTDLILAAYNGFTEVVKLLLDRGADVNTKMQDGMTALWAASFIGHDRTEIIKLLLDKGADVNAKSTNGITALMLVSRHGLTEIVKLFLDKGVDVKGTDGSNALNMARESGNEEVIALLEKAGAKEYKGSDRTTDANTKKQKSIINPPQIDNSNKGVVNGSKHILDSGLNDLLVKPGDTIDQVRSVYHTSAQPEPTNSIKPGSTALHLNDKGIWFFFDQTGKIYTVRVESPFQGSVKGVKIGDSSEMVLKSLGEPTLKDTSRFFYTPDGLQLWFDYTGAVKTIFFTK